ncbi:MAG: beta-N-acetylhexosaminidase [Acidobacteria bacterium]|nr:beta-N-acetylhexosaminidase [Acidobacteriota bacterium]
MQNPLLSQAVNRTLIALASCLLAAGAAWGKPLPTELFLRGYSVIPAPQNVALQDRDIEFGPNWNYRAKVAPDHIAIRTLLADLQTFHGIDLKPADPQSKDVIWLSVAGGSVKTGADPAIDKQAYRLKIAPGRIDIIGNADAGLFYGVQTLLQLVKPGPRGTLLLPVCSIEDWPALQLRFLHWDTKHHQDRVETLKRFLDWSARFKVNMIGFELEDKFEYPSNPVIGAPGAFTAAQLQEIVDYGLERFIQVVPQIQSPAHFAYVLKHPEFADLRADGNNYQACLCDERTYQLIFSMYGDVIKATRGVQYFHVSTDEVYYAGICARCDKPYNPENRSLKWIEFARRAHELLKEHGRTMLAWVEYPVLTRHIPLLPSDIINGVMSDDPEQVKAEKDHGLRQLVYASMQGEESLFPNHLALGGEQELARGRLESAYETILAKSGWGNPIGVYGAAWDDSGLHNETFWLGWATVARYGWRPGVPSVEQHVAEFMNVFYGPCVTGMPEVYRRLQAQARFYDRSWDRVVSRVRGPGYGNSEGKGIGTTRFDRTLPAPALPSLPGLDFVPVYAGRYARLMDEARHMALENDVLLHLLYETLSKASRNRYGLEVFLSIAELLGHHNRMILGMAVIEERLRSARTAAERNRAEEAVRQLQAAYQQARSIVDERKRTYDYLKQVWEKSRFPKGQEVNGREFLHVLDDTKDHRADRRPDLSYLIAPEESIGLESWMTRLAELGQTYAKNSGVPRADFR